MNAKSKRYKDYGYYIRKSSGPSVAFIKGVSTLILNSNKPCDNKGALQYKKLLLSLSAFIKISFAKELVLAELSGLNLFLKTLFSLLHKLLHVDNNEVRQAK